MIRRAVAALVLATGTAQAASPAAKAAPPAADAVRPAPSATRPASPVAAPEAPAAAGKAAAKAEPAAAPSWQPLAAGEGRRLEVDTRSAQKDGERIVVTSRTIFDKPVPDAVSGSAYRIIESTGRYDCAKRSAANLKRVYRKAPDDEIREETNKTPTDLPVRSGTFDDKILKAACAPGGLTALAGKAADPSRREILKAELSAGAAKPAAAPPAVAATARRRPGAAARPEPALAAADAHGHAPWSYEGPTGPAQWAKLAPENGLCASGRRQSPIDIRDPIRVDLEPIEFRYRPAGFRVVDNGHTIQVELDGNEISLLGSVYRLVQFHFHRPSEERIDGRGFEMVVHLVHRSDDGKLAVVAVMLDKGRENPVVQTVWNHIPLEAGRTTTPPRAELDPAKLLPERRDYFTFMGSLTTPPCTEGVLWLVMKTPVEISPEQADIFARLYPHNARPLQPANGRLIKGSR